MAGSTETMLFEQCQFTPKKVTLFTNLFNPQVKVEKIFLANFLFLKDGVQLKAKIFLPGGSMLILAVFLVL